jgi:predicted metal-dependent enzyme (double-stranded beta helix superfamily)
MFEIERFCADCRQAMKETDQERAVREVVNQAVADPAALMRDIGEPERAGVFTLHRSDDLTVLNLIWGPEMTLLPHDHRMWAVIGIYTGREENTFYRRSEEDGLTKLGLKIMDAKDCSYLGETAIHKVYNPLTKLTGGLHVYGGDFFGTPRSEWDPESYEEMPYDVDKNVGLFELSNKRMEELKRGAAD